MVIGPVGRAGDRRVGQDRPTPIPSAREVWPRSGDLVQAGPSWPAVDAARHLDPRVWLIWLLAAVGPALFARNPFPLLATLVAVLTVRAAWAPAIAGDGGWRLIVRLALLSAALSVLFNALTAPFGDTVLVGLPGWWPFGDIVTLNAILFGGLTALAITVIVLATTTAGLLTDWPEVLRRVPGRLLPLAVAGSVAWGFVPGTIATLRDIRDAQRLRGIRITSARAVVPILLPLIATALDRATTLAEALESRGFGGRPDDGSRRTRRSWPRSATVALAVALAVTGVYVTLDGGTITGVALLVLGVGGAGAASAGGRMAGRTRYRTRHWRSRDSAVAGAALIALVVDAVTLVTDPDALRYSPYPDIGVPAVSLPVIVAAGLLMVPAVVAPLVKVSMAGAQPLPPAPSPSRSRLRRLRATAPGPDGEGESIRLSAGQLPRMTTIENAPSWLDDRLPSSPHRRGAGLLLPTVPVRTVGVRFPRHDSSPDALRRAGPERGAPSLSQATHGRGRGSSSLPDATSLGERGAAGGVVRRQHSRDAHPVRSRSVSRAIAPEGAGPGAAGPCVVRVADRSRARPWAGWPGRVRAPIPTTRRRGERGRLNPVLAGD